MTSKRFLQRAVMTAVGLLFSANAAFAGPTYTFMSSEGDQPSNVGKITLTQVSSTTVDVLVDLADTYGFINSGGPHTPFAFTLAGGETGISANFLQPLGGNFAFGVFSINTADGDATPFGTYGVSINSTAGNGAGKAYYGDLEFQVTRTGGLTTDDFILNPALGAGGEGRAYFAANLTDGSSDGGSQAWDTRTTTVTSVPEPASMTMLLTGLVGGGVAAAAARRRRRG